MQSIRTHVRHLSGSLKKSCYNLVIAGTMFENLKNLFSTNKSYSSLVRLDGKGYSSSFSRAGSLSLYEKSLYANAAIRKRAEKVGQIDFVFRDAKGEEIKEGKEFDTWTRLLNHQINSKQVTSSGDCHKSITTCTVQLSFSKSLMASLGLIKYPPRSAC